MDTPPGRPPRQRLYFALALLFPLFLVGALEAGLRLFDYKGDLALFVRLPFQGDQYLGVNKRVAARWFTSVRNFPTPSNDIFLAEKPEGGLRLFVLGESTANGFPYGYNGTFSRVVQDALRDVMPGRVVEVVNLGIAATTTYALADEVSEILAQHPDGILVYAGHNEFYGALGTASTEAAGARPTLVRAFLRAQRLKTVLLAREAAGGIRRRLAGGPGGADSTRSLMQHLVREELIPLDGEGYARGRVQFQDNLGVILARFQEAGVPVFIASLTSNLRDQPPFRPVAGSRLPRADSVWAEGRRALESGDSARAATLLSQARDLDGLRFRATAEWKQVIQSLAREHGAHYVPVDEAFAAASPDGIPGATLFWEHLHPNETGYLIMGRAYFEALGRQGFLGRPADLARLQDWSRYQDRMELTEFDREFARHEAGAVLAGWPFVPAGGDTRYGAGFQPANQAQALAFAASVEGLGWARGKLALAEHYRAKGSADSAMAELRGLIREQPVTGSLQLLMAELFLGRSQPDSALPFLERAHALEPSARTSMALATVMLDRREFPRGIALLEEALRYQPDDPAAMLNLAYAFLITRQPARARALADRLGQRHPDFPGVAQLRAMLSGPGR